MRARTLARFEKHRRAWQKNRSLRTINADLYAQVARQLPPQTLGRRIELGSGPGFAREFIPGIELTDLVRAPWHDGEASAEALPFEAGSIGALVLFDVLHHVPSPRKFFDEAVRVLAPGGRIVMCEPYISPVSYPVYKFLHEEPLDMRRRSAGAARSGRRTRSVRLEPGDSDAVVRTEARSAFTEAFPALSIQRIQYMTGFSLPASGGFSHGPFLPFALWSLLHRLDGQVPSALMRWMAFRMLVVLERV